MIRKAKSLVLSSGRAKGIFAVFLSAFFFYLATVGVKLGPSVEVIEFVFARFVFGLVVVLLFHRRRFSNLRPLFTNPLLLGRAVTNCLALFCFFQGAKLTTLSVANILNMTYPAFIALFSVFIASQRQGPAVYAACAISLYGSFLVSGASVESFDVGAGWALASGAFAGLSLLILNFARQGHQTIDVLIVLFVFGSLATGVFVDFNHFRLSLVDGWIAILLAASCGVIGQYLLTIGFRYISSLEGSIVSSARILIAGIAGPFLVGEPFLGLLGWVGAFLILLSDVVVAYKGRGVVK